MLYDFGHPTMCGAPGNAIPLIASNPGMVVTTQGAEGAVFYEDIAARDGAFAYALAPDTIQLQHYGGQTGDLAPLGSRMGAARPITTGQRLGELGPIDPR